MASLAQGIVKFRWLIIILVTIITAFLGYQIKYIQINSDVINSLPDNDPDAVLFREIGERFGGNEIGMIIVEAEDIFTTQVLQHVKQITDSLMLMDGISSVTSITNIIDIKNGEYGLEIGKLVDEWDIPEKQEELDFLRKRVFEKEMYKGVIVSSDGTATLIVFTIPEDADAQAVSRAVIQKTESLQFPEKLYFAGAPMMVTSISDLITGDIFKLIPIAFFLIALILFLNFHTARGVILPLLTSTIASVWSIGILAMFGFELTMITNNIPILLLAIGSAYTIHVLNRINQVKESNRQKAVIIALTYIFIPVILAALTTMIGFVSFVFGAYLNMIRDFGIFTALGTFFAAVLSLFFAPAMITGLALFRKQNIGYYETARKSHIQIHFLEPLKNLLFRHPKYILTIWGVLIGLSIAAIFLINRSVDIQEYFKKDNPTRIAEDIMVRKFGGSKPIFVLFDGDMQSPEVLKTMKNTAEYMRKSPDILTTQSVADLIIELNAALGDERDIPDRRDKIEQLWFLLDGNETMQRFVSEDLDQGIIMSKFISIENQDKKDFIKDMNEFIGENASEDCKIRITGMPFVEVTMGDSLLKSQVGSLSIAIVFVIIIVGLILRSFLTGVYATIPIIAAIIVLFGFMGITGIPLNVATVLVASIALGLGIDYSIHIITHFNRCVKKSMNTRMALEETILISGKAIVINVVSVSAGFLVLVFSQMVPLQLFGLLIAFSMIGSSMGALTLLPVILILTHYREDQKKIKI